MEIGDCSLVIVGKPLKSLLSTEKREIPTEILILESTKHFFSRLSNCLIKCKRKIQNKHKENETKAKDQWAKIKIKLHHIFNLI